jgi:hypothetical protein
MPLLNNLRHRLGPVQIAQEVYATWYKGVATHRITERPARRSLDTRDDGLSSDCTLVTHWTKRSNCIPFSCLACVCLAGLGTGSIFLRDLVNVGYKEIGLPCAHSVPRALAIYTISQSRQDINSTFEEQFKPSNLPHFHFCNHAFLNTFKKSYATRPSQQTAETVHRRNKPHDTYLPTKEF